MYSNPWAKIYLMLQNTGIKSLHKLYCMIKNPTVAAVIVTNVKLF